MLNSIINFFATKEDGDEPGTKTTIVFNQPG